jgi:glutamate dehydrogenase/leucine dehydrogenase
MQLSQLEGTSKMDPVFGQLSFDDHEQIVFCNDKDTGLKAIIGIHNSVMGPALGELECLIMLMNGLP